MAYVIHLAILFSVYAILGVSLNLVMGYTGRISVAHAGFFGLGAYTTAIMTTQIGLGFFVSALIGIGVAGLSALFIGAVISHLRGDYYMLGTVAFTYILFNVFLNWEALTQGPFGIAAIPRPKIFGFELVSSASYLILAIVALGLVYALAHFLVTSSFGRVLKAIREDETAIAVFGYQTFFHKLLIFVVAGMMAALAGSVFASYITFIDPSFFDVMESVLILSIVIIGGFASIRGTIIGALIFVVLPELLRLIGFPANVAAELQQIAYGLALILLMRYRPQGIIGEYKI
jgi:branched-chain amino acid transport system permease protein